MPNTPAGKRARRRVPGTDFERSPLLAYAEGCPPGRWAPPGPLVAGSISVTAVLDAAVREPSAAGKQRLLERASEIARTLMTPEVQRMGTYFESLADPAPAMDLRTLASMLWMTEHSPLALTRQMMRALASLFPRSSVAHTRTLGTLAFYGHDAGQDSGRREIARELVSLGAASRQPEALFTGWTLLATDAMNRGNLPRMERCVRRMMRYAISTGDPRAISIARNSTGAVVGLRGDLGASVAYLWKALETADHPTLRQMVIGNLAETLYRAGYYRESRAARTASLRLPSPVGPFVIALGGYASCCSALGDVDGVRWAALEALRLADMHRDVRGTAQGLFGCAESCSEVGLDALAGRLHQRCREMAEAYDFHDLTFEGARMARADRRAPMPFEGEARQALESIVQLAPDGMPVDSVLVPA